MAKSGLTPIFTAGYVQNVFEDYVKARVNKEIAILVRIGENFVNDARTKGEYSDDTGNLRSSIGYILVNDGKVIKQNLSGKDAEGKIEAADYANVLKEKYSKGLVLIGFAGMNYAAAVEAKGYDVITNSAPTSEIMKDYFSKFLS